MWPINESKDTGSVLFCYSLFTVFLILVFYFADSIFWPWFI